MTRDQLGRAVTFELRKYVGGRWLLDSVFDDKAYAIEEAKSLKERFKSIPAVWVVAVTEEHGEFREATVFRQSIVDEEPALWKTVQSRPDTPAPAPRIPANKGADAGAPKPRRRSAWFYYAQIALGMVVVLAVGILGFAALALLR
jgi:hypothetical protein